MYRDLTRGPISRSLILFALPMMAGNLLQQFYNIADTLIVGRALGGGRAGCGGLRLHADDLSDLRSFWACPWVRARCFPSIRGAEISLPCARRIAHALVLILSRHPCDKRRCLRIFAANSGLFARAGRGVGRHARRIC